VSSLRLLRELAGRLPPRLDRTVRPYRRDGTFEGGRHPVAASGLDDLHCELSVEEWWLVAAWNREWAEPMKDRAYWEPGELSAAFREYRKALRDAATDEW
jgi:hypothetical protein